MDEELKLHIKKLQNRAMCDLIAGLLIIFSITFGVLFLFIPSFVCLIFFAFAIISVIYLIYSARSAKSEEKESKYKPVIFNSSNNFAFGEVIGKFEKLTDEKNQVSISENVRFFQFEKIFKLKTVVYQTDDFNKKEFADAKKRINKKANKELNISHRVIRQDRRNLMRFYIIYANNLNNELYGFISQNANHNLTRAEGLINIAIVGNQIMIPALYGQCDLIEIGRYKRVIKFINQVLINDK